MAIPILVLDPEPSDWPVIFELRQHGIKWNFDIFVMTEIFTMKSLNGVKLISSCHNNNFDEYQKCILDFCLKFNIVMVIPFRNITEFYNHEAEFKSYGISIFLPNESFRTLTNNYGNFLLKAREMKLPIPKFSKFTNNAEFTKALKEFKNDEFFVQLNVPNYETNLINVDKGKWEPQKDYTNTVNLSDLKEYLSSIENFEGVLIKKLYRMSIVDVICWDGIVLNQVEKVDYGDHQIIVYKDSTYEICRKIADEFKLSGIFGLILMRENSDVDRAFVYGGLSELDEGVVFSSRSGESLLCRAITHQLGLESPETFPEPHYRASNMMNITVPFDR